MKKSSLIDLNVFRKVLIGLGISSSLFYPNNALADSYLTSKNEVTTTVQQTKKITGNVTNTAGEPIIGATVLEKGNTTNGTITDIDGNFTINLPANATLSISYIGYITQEIQVGYQTSFKVVLKDDTKTLDEIIVVGYGSQKKANLTGAVSSVKMDEALGDRPLLNAADALQGAVPGLFVSNGGNAPGTSKSFQIRGAYSLGVKNSDGTYGNTIKPLVLIDNVEGDIDMINPEDIESINVLKDAASAAIYGARAAGGVILVTTKRPKGASRFELNYNNNFAFGKAVNLPKQAPLMDYLQAYLDCGYSDAYWSLGSPSVSKWMEYLTAYQKDPSSFNTVGDGIYVDESGVPYYLNEKDLYKNFMETSFQMTHNISASGGTDKLRYRISGGYNSNDGVLISDRDKFERMNVNSFISADVTKWFTQEITMSYAHSLQTSPGGMGGVYNTRLVSYYPEGELPASVNTLADEDLPLFTPRNQILYSNPVNNKNDNPRIFLKSILKPLKGLEAVFEYTFDKNIYDYHWYTGQYDYTTIQGGSSKSFVDDYLRKYKQHTNYNSINVYATYNKDFGNHHFKVMAGFNQESSYQETLDTYSYNQAVLDVPAMSSGTGTIKATDSYSEYAIRGGFFRVNYNYLDKYLAEINFRSDASSKFGPGNQRGYFPSISLGWRMSSENFMADTEKVDDLKLRFSWGQTGSTNIDDFVYRQFYEKGNPYIGQSTLTPGLLPNPDIKWERTSEFNGGLDYAFFNHRLFGSIDGYYRYTKGALAPSPYPLESGSTSYTSNLIDLSNKGVEIEIGGDIIRTADWTWTSKFNIALNRNKIEKLNGAELSSNDVDTYIEGQPAGVLKGYIVEKIFQNDDEVVTLNKTAVARGANYYQEKSTGMGDFKYKDLDGNGYIDSKDREVIATPQPKFFGGFFNSVNYKNFNLSFVFQFSQGAKAAVYNMMSDMYGYIGNNIYPELYGKTWSPENPDARYARLVYTDPSKNSRFSDRYIYETSYLRLKNISYNLPQNFLKKINVQSAMLFVSGSNIWTVTQWPGIDPELISSFTTSQMTLNEDPYPLSKTFTLGVKVEF